MNRWLCVILFSLLNLHMSAQTCNIIPSKTTLCLGETVSLGVSISGGSPVSFFWELGDGNTSTSPNHILYTYSGYMNTGSKKYAPRVTIQFSNGSTCVALSDSITIYRLPNVHFSIESEDTMCFEKNELVIKDLLTPSVSSVPLFRRILQLNNGHTQIQFYLASQVLNYFKCKSVNAIIFKFNVRHTTNYMKLLSFQTKCEKYSA